MVIEEVSAIQENLEIEKMCRESAEALASKVQLIFTWIMSALVFKDSEVTACHIYLNPTEHGYKWETCIMK